MPQIGAAVEEGNRFAKKQDPVAAPRRLDECGEVLFGLANVFRDDGGDVDAVDLPPIDVDERARCLGLADAWRIMDERAAPRL